MKIARVTPILKKGEHTNPCNYRSISSLGFMSKKFETCLQNRLYAFLNKYEPITNSQFGFLKQISNNDALNHLIEFLCKDLNSREHISCIFVDLRKAFNTVNHRKLHSKLEQIGVWGLGLELFMSYLSHRKQYDYLNGNSSTLKNNYRSASGQLNRLSAIPCVYKWASILVQPTKLYPFCGWHNSCDKKWQRWKTLLKMQHCSRTIE